MKIKTIALVLSLTAGAYAQADDLRMSWWGGNSRHAATNEAVDTFEASSGVKVKTEFTGWGGHLERLTTQIAGNTEPDVMQTNWNWMPIFSRDGQGFKDLNDYKHIIDLSNFDPAALELATNNGRLNGIPISMTARIFYYNEYLWAKAGLALPDTWEALFAAGPQFKEQLGEQFFPLVVEGRDVLAMTRSYFVQKYGIPMIDEKNKTFAYSDEQLVAFFQFYADLVEQHVVPSSKYIASFGAANLYEHKPWINGEWGGLYMWNSAINKYNDNLKPPMTMALGQYPFLTGADDSGLFYKPAQMFSIGKNSNNAEEAARLINFILNEPEGVKKMALARGVPLSSTAMQTLIEEGQINNNDLSVNGLAQISALPRKLGTSPFFENPKILGLYQELIEKMDHGSITVAEAAKEFKRRGDRILRKAMR
ncbi:MAG: ABC transporter substrate-binding protein [Pontibacterium sp.]